MVGFQYITHGKGTASYRHALEPKALYMRVLRVTTGVLGKRPGIFKVVTITDDQQVLSEVQHVPLDLKLSAISSEKLKISGLVLNPISLLERVVMSRTLWGGSSAHWPPSTFTFLFPPTLAAVATAGEVAMPSHTQYVFFDSRPQILLSSTLHPLLNTEK